jgi:hypothetical protein
VDSFYYTIYGDPKNPKAHRYTQNIKLPYPKVGTANPTIKLFVVDLNDQAQLAKEVIPPQSFFDNHGDDYIYWRAYWIADSKIGIIWMNRVQVRLCDIFLWRGMSGLFYVTLGAM